MRLAHTRKATSLTPARHLRSAVLYHGGETQSARFYHTVVQFRKLHLNADNAFPAPAEDASLTAKPTSLSPFRLIGFQIIQLVSILLSRSTSWASSLHKTTSDDPGCLILFSSCNYSHSGDGPRCL